MVLGLLMLQNYCVVPSWPGRHPESSTKEFWECWRYLVKRQDRGGTLLQDLAQGLKLCFNNVEVPDVWYEDHNSLSEPREALSPPHPPHTHTHPPHTSSCWIAGPAPGFRLFIPQSLTGKALFCAFDQPLVNYALHKQIDLHQWPVRV